MYKNNHSIIPFVLSYALSAGLIIGGILGVPHKKQCNLSSTYHVHLYTREIGNVTIKKWLQNENDILYYKKNDNLLPVTSFDLKLYDKLNNYSLFDGRDNIDYINYQITQNRDYMEFYYRYTDHYYTTDSKGHTRMHTITRSGWSDSPDHRGVTGQVRVYHTKYYAYNVVYNNDDFELQKSDYVDDIREIINDYPYMNENTNIEVYEDFNFPENELNNLNLDDFNPFYTPTVENNPLETSSKTLTLKHN